MIPLSTTTVTVTEPGAGDEYAEPYSTPAPRTVSATGVRAVIDYPGGREQIAGGEQAIWDFRLICDKTPISRSAQVRDDTSDLVYRVEWVMQYPQHTEAGLRYVEGEI